MPQQNDAGSAVSVETVAPAAAATPEPNATPEPAASASDGWGAARKAFFPDGDVTATVDETSDEESDGESAEATGDVHDSEEQSAAAGDDDPAETPESDAPANDDPLALKVDYQLDDLVMPGKFKPLVKERIDAILADATAQHSRIVGDYQQANASLGQAFVSILQADNPLQRLQELAAEAVPALGLPETLLAKFQPQETAAHDATPQGQDVPSAFNTAQLQERVNAELSAIEDKYWPQMEATDDPKVARQLFGKMEREKMAVLSAVQDAKLKAIMTAFYGKLIKPTFDQFGNLQQDAEAKQQEAVRTVQKGHWNTADQQMAKNHADWPKYKAKVKALMKERYPEAIKAANTNGRGHLELLRDLYLVVSRQDHLSAAKRPHRGTPGVQPHGKHLTTQRAGGSSWDDIQRTHWHDLVPDDA